MKNRIRISTPFVIPLLISLGVLSNSGCSTSTVNNASTVNMQSQLAASDVNRTIPIKLATPTNLNFDSIVVTNAIVFVNNIKLHSEQDDSLSDDRDQTIKTGPFVLVFDSSGEHTVTSATIPPGTYDRVKFEFHKPDKNADAAILAEFPQLQNGGQTYTVWIYGYTVRAGIRTSFAVTSVHSENITLRFEDQNFNDRGNIVLGANTTSLLAFELDPRLIFRIAGSLFDPHDLTHQGDIDSNLLVAIRVVEF